MSWYDNIFGHPDDPANRQQLTNYANQAGGFAGQAQQGFNQYGMQGQQALDYLRGQMQGQNSVSAEQLRQGLQQQVAQQQAMAASAGPQNAAMAAQMAMNNAARASYGMSGQQALAGLQERNQAAQQYAALLQGLRGQNLQGVLGGYQGAMGGYGQMIQNPQQSAIQQMTPLLSAGSSTAGMIAASDKRLKKDIADGEGDAEKLLKGLKSYTFSYKDEQYGKGKQIGVMAQDLEKALPQAVIDTPAGKAVHGAKLATALAAVLPTLDKRLSALESKPAIGRGPARIAAR